MKNDLHCVEGRLLRHDPQFDDPAISWTSSAVWTALRHGLKPTG